jgi:orotate phosphoribosyltransferase
LGVLKKILNLSLIKVGRMTSMNRMALLRILAQNSFRFAETELSAGGTSDYYIDCRTTTLRGEGGRLAGLVILDLIREKQLAPLAVGGLTLGADPIVSNVASASAWLAQDTPESAVIDGFLVRKAEKAHGTGRRIEGFYQPGAPVVIVDDACTTGASLITAIHAAREAGMRIVGVACLVEREEANGRPAVEAAAEGAPFFSVFRAQEVCAEFLTPSEMRKQLA